MALLFIKILSDKLLKRDIGDYWNNQDKMNAAHLVVGSACLPARAGLPALGPMVVLKQDWQNKNKPVSAICTCITLTDVHLKKKDNDTSWV